VSSVLGGRSLLSDMLLSHVAPKREAVVMVPMHPLSGGISSYRGGLCSTDRCLMFYAECCIRYHRSLVPIGISDLEVVDLPHVGLLVEAKSGDRSNASIGIASD